MSDQTRPWRLRKTWAHGVSSVSGVELGLRAKIPCAGTLNSNGDGTYSHTLLETDHDNNPGTPNR